MNEIDDHAYRGARAMVALHERHLREFLAAWRRARAAEVPLPAAPDPDYASLETLLRHVLGCARGYMVWMCEVLELSDPGIAPVPDAAEIEARADEYLEHVVDRWRAPLRGVPEERFASTHPSRWGVAYCVDAMLEHAVMHPIRHTFQIEEWLGDRQSST